MLPDAQLDALVADIQADVDELLAADPHLNKVVLLAHMQQISIEQALATRLSNVDILSLAAPILDCLTIPTYSAQAIRLKALTPSLQRAQMATPSLW